MSQRVTEKHLSHRPRHGVHRRPRRRIQRFLVALTVLAVVPTAATVADAARVGPSPTTTTAGPPAPVTASNQTTIRAVRGVGPRTMAPRVAVATVAAGDTVWSIAADARVPPGVLARHNGFDDDIALVAGSHLVVPSPSGPAQPAGDRPRADRPRAFSDHPDRAALEPVFDRWAAHFGVPAPLLKALAWVESGWDSDERSSAGAVGIGQLLPVRAAYLASEVARMPLDPAVAADNIALTAAQLRVLLDETGDVATAVAAYRQGITDVRLHGVDPAQSGYVRAVIEARRNFR